MTLLDLLRPRPAASALRADCPFCPGSRAAAGPLCSVCRTEALRLGGLRL